MDKPERKRKVAILNVVNLARNRDIIDFEATPTTLLKMEIDGISEFGKLDILGNTIRLEVSALYDTDEVTMWIEGYDTAE